MRRDLSIRKLKKYTPTRFMAETSHYDKAGADFAVSFIQSLCHTKGTWAGKPFELIDWQEQIIRDLFGVLKENGYRQFKHPRNRFMETGACGCLCRKQSCNRVYARIQRRRNSQDFPILCGMEILAESAGSYVCGRCDEKEDFNIGATENIVKKIGDYLRLFR